MAKKVISGDAARAQIRLGLATAASTVSSTLGPKGKLVAITNSYGAPTITKDGVTVAKALSFADPAQNIGAEIVKQVASKTADVAGDGTTTATVLTYAIYESSQRYITAGANVSEISRGLNLAVQQAVKIIEKMATPISTKDIDKLKNVATISANNDEKIGEQIAQVLAKVGQDGVITVEESQSLEQFSYEEVTGLQIDRGYISSYFVTDSERMEAVIEDASVFITDKKISSAKELVGVIEKLIQGKGKKNIVIIAEDVDAEALATLILNKLRGALNVLAIKAPGFGDRRKEMLQDIAILTGATVITEELGRTLDSVTVEDFGQAGRVVSTKDDTTFVDGKGDKKVVDARVSQIKSQIEVTTSDYDKEKLQERLGKLTGGVAVIKVGASTEVEMKELKDRIDDSLHSTKAALAEGIVAGGGVAYLDIARELSNLKLTGDQQYGVDILVRALREPSLTILRNANVDAPEKIVAESGKGIGYNTLTNESNIKMVEAGIIDPAKVVRIAIEAAASAVGTLEAVYNVIVDIKEEKDSSSGMNPGMGGMGGMGMDDMM
jgi:chaperonin GroEL